MIAIVKPDKALDTRLGKDVVRVPGHKFDGKAQACKLLSCWRRLQQEGNDADEERGRKPVIALHIGVMGHLKAIKGIKLKACRCVLFRKPA